MRHQSFASDCDSNFTNAEHIAQGDLSRGDSSREYHHHEELHMHSLQLAIDARLLRPTQQKMKRIINFRRYTS